MAALSTIIAGAALATSAATSVASMSAAKKSAKAQNKALDYQKKQNDLSAMRQKRDAIRAARVARAQAINSSENQGVSSSSSAQGGQGSIQSQLNSELSFLDTWNAYSDQASQALGKANKYQTQAQTFGAISGFSMSVFNNSDAISGKLNKVFGKNG